MNAASLEKVEFIPITIEFSTATHKINDMFLWNLHGTPTCFFRGEIYHSPVKIEKLTSPAHFANVFCADLDLPQDPYAKMVEDKIKEQIEEWGSVIEIPITSTSSLVPGMNGTGSKSDAEFIEWEGERLKREEDIRVVVDVRSLLSLHNSCGFRVCTRS
jgi:hypothetical protein